MSPPSSLTNAGLQFRSGCSRPSPQFLAGDPRAFGHGFQFCPHDAGVHAPVELLLRKAAVGAGDHVLASNYIGKPDDAFGNEFRMLDHIGAVAYHAGSQNLPLGKFDVFPDPPLVLVAGIRRLDQIRARPHPQNQIDDLLERDIRGVRSGPTTPANVVANPVLRNPLQSMVQYVDVAAQPSIVVFETSRRHHPIVGYGGARVVHLQQNAGVDNRLVFSSQCLRQSYQEVLIVPVILVLPVRMALEGAATGRNASSTFTSRSAALKFSMSRLSSPRSVYWIGATQITSCVVTFDQVRSLGFSNSS